MKNSFKIKMSTRLGHLGNELYGLYHETYENQSTCNLNIQRNSHAPKLGTRNRYRESSEFDIETSNCFSPLSEADESLNEQLQQNSDNKRAQILLIGNSHIDRIRIENLLSNCLIHKYVGYTFDEMFEKN
jgi:hypothetical protein